MIRASHVDNAYNIAAEENLLKHARSALILAVMVMVLTTLVNAVHLSLGKQCQDSFGLILSINAHLWGSVFNNIDSLWL